MSWATRQHSKLAIDRAGRAIVGNASGTELELALRVVNNWRSCHAFPLNTLQVGLRRMAKETDRNAIVAQRIKRIASIQLKLQRFPTMTLSQMQDLGGCRAIVSNTRAVLRLADSLRHSRAKHKLHTFDNYIDKPQASGYRGVHMIFKYHSDRNSTYNAQKIEIQLRSAIQHSWATAVETVGTFTSHALKSSIGPDRWLRFFALMGSTFAIQEGTHTVPGTPDDRDELLQELKEISAELDVVNRLATYGQALTRFNADSANNADYFLIQLDPLGQRTFVQGFKSAELSVANEKYLELEKRSGGNAGTDAVLVSVDSISVLQKAFPNYFWDTTAFVKSVQEALRAKSLRKKRTA